MLNHDTGRVVWCAKGHGKEVLESFFDLLTEDQRRSVLVVTADGARWIANVIAGKCPNAERVMDPFHVISWMTDILDEIRQCVADGAKEVTLLGQNVNSFGYGIGDRYAFSKLLRACGTIDGLERVRFTSPHPAAFTDDVIAAMAETPNIMHQLHFPLQSGSDRILRAMRRSYRSAKFLDILGRIRAAMPDAQISTDIIVGFPGETEEDFQQTMDVVRQARFSSAFTFIYSPRPGTPAAAMEQIPRDVVQDRFDRLVALQEQITEENLATFEGRDVEVMITGKLGKKDTDTHRVTGREKTGVLVHIGVPEGEPVPEIGDFVTATVTHAGRHNLLADPDVAAGQTYSVRH